MLRKVKKINSTCRSYTLIRSSCSQLAKVLYLSSRKRIAFPGRESQFPGIDRDSGFRPSTYFYLHDRSWIAGKGTKGGGAITGRTRHHSRPMTGPHRHLWTIDIAGGGAPKTAGEESTGGARPGKHNGYQPPDDGPGESPPPPVGRRWTIGRHHGWDGRMKM